MFGRSSRPPVPFPDGEVVAGLAYEGRRAAETLEQSGRLGIPPRGGGKVEGQEIIIACDA
jgi:hypothetical protein